MSDNERRERYGRALAEDHGCFWEPLTEYEREAWRSAGDAAIAVADEELAADRAEAVERCGDICPASGLTVLDRECVLRPGHQGSHTDGQGARWLYPAPGGAGPEARTTYRAEALREAADALDASETLRAFTDDHMRDVNAAANELRRMAAVQQLADEWSARPNGADVSDLVEIQPAPALPTVGDRYVNRLDPSDVVTVSRAWTTDDGQGAVAYVWRDDKPGVFGSVRTVEFFHRLFRRSDS